MEEAIRVALIYGSTRKGRFCDTVARWAASQIVADSRFLLEILDPGVDDGTDSLPKPGSEAIGSPQAVIERADAVVVVTPEYNHGYPAPLKALIDSTGCNGMPNRSPSFLTVGSQGGLRAVEQLRQVFAELHAVTVRDALSFAVAWEQFDADGCRCRLSEGTDRWERCSNFFTGGALASRNARSARPYLTGG
jgi:NAD(P)H-dependent FMN reductase